MDAKVPSEVPQQLPGSPRPRLASAMRRPWSLLKTFCIAFTIVSLFGTPFDWYRLYVEDTTITCTFPARPTTAFYQAEHIGWEPCGELSGHKLECSSIDVPANQFDPEESGDLTFSIGLLRMRGHEAGQGKNLLLNPGGPGGSGLEFLYRKGEIINSIVGEGYHLLAFDPRGVNTSTPQALCYPDKETQEKLKTVRDKYPVEDSPELFAWTENFVQGCIDTTGEHGKYINTPQTAADMNSILDAVGQEKMAYWGFSYGTILGQTYATLYPERSERVIIDGVANLFDWYEANFDIEMFADTDHIFDSFFDECAKAGDRCALSEFGATGEMIQAQFMVIADALKRQPAPVYINASLHGLLDYETLLYQAFFPSLYKPALWHELAQDVASLMRGNATDFFLAHAVGSAFNLEGDALTFVSANDGQSGPSFWPQSRRDLLSDILPFLNVSMFAPTENSYYYRKSKWPLPKTHDFHPKRSVETSSPLLILSTTYDPVCPLRSAKVAEGAFEGSKLVEVLGYGHCSISMPSSCLAGHVRKFLNDGELPDTDKQCEVDIPYFLPPDEQKLFLEEMLGNGYDARKLYSAQLELAREMTWSRR